MQRHPISRSTVSTAILVLCAGVSLGCTDDDDPDSLCEPGSADCLLSHTLFVAHEGLLSSYDIATGEERPGSVSGISAPVDLQALEDGSLIVNLTGTNEVLVANGFTMLEVARHPSSGDSGRRPVHGYVTPEYGGKQYWVTMNDGEQGDPETNSALFLDITEGSATRFEVAGEVGLGVGHHKASFSGTQERVVISNIADCDDVLSVYDYSDIEDIELLATFTGEDAGFDAEDPGEGEFDPSFCDPTYERGLPPAPHGCATSHASGKAYCSVTSSGDIVAVDIDASEPTFTRIATSGSGGGFTFAHPGGRYIYMQQESPREGDGGEPCQIGQLAVIDSTKDEVVAELPLFYRGPDCTEELAGTDAESANPGHSHFAHHGTLLYIPISGGFNQSDARVDQLVVVDTSDPADPEQLESIEVGVHTGHSASALSGDERSLFVVNTVDGTVSQIDAESRSVVKTFTVSANPKVVATFGTIEGPSEVTGPVH